jgi:hypothetical protein
VMFVFCVEDKENRKNPPRRLRRSDNNRKNSATTARTNLGGKTPRFERKKVMLCHAIWDYRMQMKQRSFFFCLLIVSSRYQMQYQQRSSLRHNDETDAAISTLDRLKEQKLRLLQSGRRSSTLAVEIGYAEAAERKILSSVEMLDHMKHLFSRSAATDAERRDAIANYRPQAAHLAPPQRKSDVPLAARLPLPAALSQDAELERAAVLRDLVKTLRLECTAWTKELLFAYPQGTFDAFFSTALHPLHYTPNDAALPPPPEEEILLRAYQTSVDSHDRHVAAQQSQDAVAQTVQQIQLQSRWHLGQHVAVSLDQDRAAPLGKRVPLDPVRVLRMDGKVSQHAKMSADLQLVQQTVQEAHALSLLMHVMNTAAVIDRQRHPMDGSRGSSETPSVTTIASMNDHVSNARLAAAQHDKQHHTTNSTVNVPAGATSLMRTAGVVSAISSMFSPVVAARAVPSHAASFVNAPESHLVVKSDQNQPRSIQFQDTTVDTTRASTHNLGGTSPIPNAEMVTSSSDMRTTTATTSTSRERTSDPTSTAHDTSTAATAGQSDKSATRQPNPKTNVWGAIRDTATNDSGESAQRQGSISQGSTASKKKKKKGLFSCVRRGGSDSD